MLASYLSEAAVAALAVSLLKICLATSRLGVLLVRVGSRRGRLLGRGPSVSYSSYRSSKYVLSSLGTYIFSMAQQPSVNHCRRAARPRRSRPVRVAMYVRQDAIGSDRHRIRGPLAKRAKSTECYGPVSSHLGNVG